MKAYQNKVALITDCSTNLGIIMVENLVEVGMTTIAFGKNDTAVDNAKKMIQNLFNKNTQDKIVFVRCDITNVNQLEEAFTYIKDNHEGIDVLINNATCNFDCQVSSGSFEDFDEIINTNINALVACINLTSKSMLEKNTRGHIINMNDIKSYEVPDQPDKSVYLATKASVTAINEILRHEFRYMNANIKVTNVACGDFDNDTPFNKAKDLAAIVMDILDTPEHLQIHEMLVQWDPVNSIN